MFNFSLSAFPNCSLISSAPSPCVTSWKFFADLRVTLPLKFSTNALICWKGPGQVYWDPETSDAQRLKHRRRWEGRCWYCRGTVRWWKVSVNASDRLSSTINMFLAQVGNDTKHATWQQSTATTSVQMYTNNLADKSAHKDRRGHPSARRQTKLQGDAQYARSTQRSPNQIHPHVPKRAVDRSSCRKSANTPT